MVEARIVLDSMNPAGARIVTWELTYPRFIHSEFMTHRVFSRNAASSRAIPAAKFRDAIEVLPGEPVWWGKNQAGMQAAEELSDEPLRDQFGREIGCSPRERARKWWLEGARMMLAHHREGESLGIHKQIVNRVLEPWMHITVIATATEHDNFFKLRAHPAAQPEFQALVFKMKELYDGSVPQQLEFGDWHLPFVTDEDVDIAWDVAIKKDDGYALEILRKMSTARCARVSYVRQNERKEWEEDVKLCDRLSSSGHWSPFEHPAMALDDWRRHGNFCGWKQYRKFFSDEAGTTNKEQVL